MSIDRRLERMEKKIDAFISGMAAHEVRLSHLEQNGARQKEHRWWWVKWALGVLGAAGLAGCSAGLTKLLN